MRGTPAEQHSGRRIPAHTLLMDRIYRHQRHIYDLTRRHYLAGRVRLIRSLNAAPGDRILEIGCGTAWNLIRIARRYPGTELVGIDASTEMLRSASRAIDRAGFQDRIHLQHALAEDVPALFREERFHHVIFSYSLSMIPDFNAAVFAAGQVMTPEGRLSVVDFGDLEGIWRPAAMLLRDWLRLFHVQPRSEFLNCAETLARSRPDCALQLLPGRYAFVFKASRAAIAALNGKIAGQ